MSTLALKAASLLEVSKVNPAKTQTGPQQVENIDMVLVERVRGGDTNAFRKLVERYQQRVLSIALGVVGNYQDAEDIAQEAFLKAYRNLGSFRGHSSFYTWLYRIALNLAIDLSRKAYRRSERSIEETFPNDSAIDSSNSSAGGYMAHNERPDEYLHRMEVRRRFYRALESLSPQHRATIILREIDGLSYTEIADVVGCSKGTVMSRLHHARKRLQKALEESGEEDVNDSKIKKI
jgi:RNA polymerase sigma-70 factor, ECF subfamily